MPADDTMPGPIATGDGPYSAATLATAPAPGPAAPVSAGTDGGEADGGETDGAETDGAGTDGGEADGDTAVIDDLEAILDGIDAALLRLDDGSYGRCRTCGAVVDDARLTGDPAAELCEPCASTVA